MGFFHRRPLALGLLLFMLSGAVAFFFNTDLRFLALSAFVFTIIIAISLLLKRKKNIPIFVLIFLLICIGFTRSYFYKADFDATLDRYSSKTSQIELTVNKINYSLPYRSSCEATVTKIDGKGVRIDVIFETNYDSALKPGMAIRTLADVSDFDQDEDGFKEKAYYNSKGIFLKVTEIEGEVFEVIAKSSTVNRIKVKANLLRNKLVSLIDQRMPDENGLPAAIFFGDRSALGEADKASFRRTGTYHLLALSGLHLSILASILNFLLSMLALKKGKRLLIITPVILCYVALTGFSLSVVRAAIMLFISYAAYLVRREKDSITSLMIAGALICAVSPCAISDVGFILSFSTTFGIIAFFPIVEEKLLLARSVKFAGKAIYYVLSSLGISAVALLSALPITWLYFGKVSILSPVGTLILSPFVSCIMLLTPLTLIFGAVPFVGNAIGHLIFWASKCASHVAALLAKPDNIELSLDYFFTPFFFVPFFVLILIVIFFKLKHLKIYLSAALAIMLCFFAFHTVYVQTTPISAQFLRRGENEYLIISKGGQNTLVDVSDGSYGNLSYIANETASRGYCQIDALILTHYHTKHIATISRLLKNQTVRQIILPDPISDSENDVMLSVTEVAYKQDVDVKIYSLENGFTLFGSTSAILNREYVKASTHPILSLELRGDVNLSYLSSSFASWHEVEALCENVIVGTHGPIQKKEFRLPLPENLRLLSLADRTTADLMSKDCPKPPDTCTILLSPTMIKIK